MKYINAEIAYFDSDPDFVSRIELVHCLRKVRVSVHDKLWYKLPELDLENGIKPIDSDNSIMEMFGFHRDCSSIAIYVGSIELDETWVMRVLLLLFKSVLIL